MFAMRVYHKHCAVVGAAMLYYNRIDEISPLYLANTACHTKNSQYLICSPSLSNCARVAELESERDMERSRSAPGPELHAEHAQLLARAQAASADADTARRAALAIDNARLYQETRDAAQRVDETLALLDTVLSSAPFGFAFYDHELRFLRINETMAAINGQPIAAHMGRTLADMVPRLAPTLEPLFQRILATGAALLNLEFVDAVPYGSGQLQTWLANYYPVHTKDGQLLGVGAMVSDITEHKRAEADRLLLASIVEASDDAIVGTSVDGIIQSWNAGAERMYGYSAAEAVGQMMTLITPPDRLAEIAWVSDQIMQGQSIRQYETIHMHKNGTPIMISLTISPIKNLVTRPIGVAHIARDISASKQAQAALLASQELYRLITEHTSDLISLFDGAGRYIYVSPSYQAMLGYDPEALLGTVALDLLHPDDRDTLIPQWRQLLSGSRSAESVMRMANGAGSNLRAVSPNIRAGACS